MAEQVKNPFELGPYLQIATLCERVLREADGVSSLIRIVDTVTHHEHGPNPPEEMPEFHFPLTLFICFKSGRARGRHEISIIPEQPSGESLTPMIVSVNLEGENKGVNIASRIDIPYKYEGLYWFRVEFDKKLVTRIPLEVRYSRIVTGPSGPSGRSP